MQFVHEQILQTSNWKGAKMFPENFVNTTKLYEKISIRFGDMKNELERQLEKEQFERRGHFMTKFSEINEFRSLMQPDLRD